MQIILISMLFSFAFQWLHVPPQIIPQDMLRKYVTYAKQNVFPRMADADSDKIALVYADLRRQLQVRGAGAKEGKQADEAVQEVAMEMGMGEAAGAYKVPYEVVMAVVESFFWSLRRPANWATAKCCCCCCASWARA